MTIKHSLYVCNKYHSTIQKGPVWFFSGFEIRPGRKVMSSEVSQVLRTRDKTRHNMSMYCWITLFIFAFAFLPAAVFPFSAAPATATKKRGGGGRSPDKPDKIDPSEDWTVEPTQPSECRLIICQITDVYTLEHLASFKTMVQDIKAKAGESTNVVSMLTGDFLSPYLLSSVERGAGMMNALAKIPLDVLT